MNMVLVNDKKMMEVDGGRVDDGGGRSGHRVGTISQSNEMDQVDRFWRAARVGATAVTAKINLPVAIGLNMFYEYMR